MDVVFCNQQRESSVVNSIVTKVGTNLFQNYSIAWAEQKIVLGL